MTSLQHHTDKANKHQKLLVQLSAAKQAMTDKHKAWKQNNTDVTRFAFQASIGVVNRLEKKLWKFQ